MYSTTKTVKESDSLKPPDLKPALQLFEQTVSDTIIKWFNANKQTNEKETLVYKHLLNNPMVVGLSLQISALEKQLDQAKQRISSLTDENNNLKLQLSSSDTKNVTLDITEIKKDSTVDPEKISSDIQNDNQKHLNEVVKKLESYSASGYNIVSDDNSEDDDDDDDDETTITTPLVMGALFCKRM